MVYYWNKNTKIAEELLRDKVCLELGSGTGIVGIAASLFDAKKVYLTDLPEYLAIL
jgi:predicted nicotinamide N-methyase